MEEAKCVETAKKRKFRHSNSKITPPPGIEPGSRKGPALKAGAVPLCHGGLLLKYN